MAARLLKLLLAVLIGAASAFLVTGIARGESPGQTWARFSAWAGLAGAPGAPQRVLSASVLVGGSEHAASDGRLGLPSGTRFQLRVHATRAGVVQLHAINPEGKASVQPLWTADIGADGYVVTPVLRLEGTQGKETLRLRLTAAGSTTELGRQDVEIWHQ